MIFKNLVFTEVVLFKEIIAFCSENRKCWEKNGVLIIKVGGTYSCHWALKGYSSRPKIVRSQESGCQDIARIATNIHLDFCLWEGNEIDRV
jgi:hypothetical protein